MASSKFICFAEIVKGRDSSVRVTDDGLFDVVDIVTVVAGKDCNQANETLRNLKPSLFDKENFFIRNGRRYATPRDIIALIMVLPGKIAKEIRSQFAVIIEEYIKKHVVSGDSGALTQATPVPNNVVTKRQLERDDALFEMEMAERRQRLVHLTVETNVKAAEAQSKAAEAQSKVLEVQKMLMDTYTSLCPNRVIDDRARLMFKDNFLNIASPASSQLAIENGNIGNIGKSFTVNDVAVGLKLSFNRGDNQKIGKIAAAAYREKYGQEPSKHEQYVDGAVRLVNSYTERDRGMLEAVVRSYVR